MSVSEMGDGKEASARAEGGLRVAGLTHQL